ncbi:MAG: hypothetical protein CL944_00110 [Candidatus Diapherotrites archaeon]|uniref:Uncharacterized protein n=1 Tax=Candidatus Iainarchaeum sp. TaxID=3101447 RepID=A0A2D6LP54_9ARCH|nr:hypothetical protein [Candidatus Diapherotrites archaeon]|tara:strand:+ start:14348 stop:14677 length:330 start_codon:yes stop_codon:yes gene_type:complete
MAFRRKKPSVKLKRVFRDIKGRDKKLREDVEGIPDDIHKVGILIDSKLLGTSEKKVVMGRRHYNSDKTPVQTRKKDRRRQDLGPNIGEKDKRRKNNRKNTRRTVDKESN